MAAPRLDLSRLPLVRVTFDGLASDAEFDKYLSGITDLLMVGRQKTVTVLDARASARAPATQRKRQAAWIKEHESLLRRYSLGTAFVITSPLVRGVLTAILWLQQLPTPHTVVATIAEAERWATEQFRRAGVTAPPPPAAGADL